MIFLKERGKNNSCQLFFIPPSYWNNCPSILISDTGFILSIPQLFSLNRESMNIRMKTGTGKAQRLEWVDILKSFGIFLVFLGHLLHPNTQIGMYIYSFHMPLFFFISGMFFKYSDVADGFHHFFIKKLRVRMIPYMTFGILTYLIWMLQMLLKKYGVYQGSQPVPENLLKPLVGMFYGNGFGGWLVHNTLLWFLVCLFVTELLFFYINKMSGNKSSAMLLILILFAFLGYADSIYSPIRLPFSIDVAFVAIVFYGLGYVLRNGLPASWLGLFFAIVCLAVGILTSHLNGRIDMNENHYGNGFLFYLSALSNIYFYIYLFAHVANSKYLERIAFVGKNSLVFFLMQNPSFLAVNVLAYLALRIKVSYPFEFNTLYGSVYALLALILLVPVSYFVIHCLPFMIGKKVT